MPTVLAVPSYLLGAVINTRQFIYFSLDLRSKPDPLGDAFLSIFVFTLSKF